MVARALSLLAGVLRCVQPLCNSVCKRPFPFRRRYNVTNGPQLVGKWVVFDRGMCNFTTKLEAAIAFNATGVIVVNTKDRDWVSGLHPLFPLSLSFTCLLPAYPPISPPASCRLADPTGHVACN